MDPMGVMASTSTSFFLNAQHNHGFRIFDPEKKKKKLLHISGCINVLTVEFKDFRLRSD